MEEQAEYVEESDRLSVVLDLLMILDIDGNQVSNDHYNVSFPKKSQYIGESALRIGSEGSLQIK